MNKVSEIHASHLYGIVVETGCSTSTSSKLMDVNGASKSVLYGFQPYSKELEQVIYGEFPRSVSIEFIESVLNKEGKSLPEKMQERINFVLASSWQLHSDEDPLQTPHGWFGFLNKITNKKHFLHFTINRNILKSYQDLIKGKHDKNKIYQETRNLLIDIIGEIGVNIIHTAISGEINEFNLNNIKFNEFLSLDMAYIIENDVKSIDYNLLISVLEKYKGDYFLTFKHEAPIRLEDLLRENNEIIIQKGSFNPIHHGHVEMMKESNTKHNATQSFLISTYRYDKPHISTEELINRIRQINKVGYTLIICKSIYYYETFSLFSKWSYGKRFYFPIGTDTLIRIHDTDVNHVNEWNNKNVKNPLMKMSIRGYIEKTIRMYPNFKFISFNRKGYEKPKELSLYDSIVENINWTTVDISSTAIREGKAENKLEL